MITEEDINQAYAVLEITRKRLFDAVSEEAGAKSALEASESLAILRGLITGKNESERKAARSKVLENEIHALDFLEETRRGAQYDFQVAESEVERIKLIIRLLELSR